MSTQIVRVNTSLLETQPMSFYRVGWRVMSFIVGTLNLTVLSEPIARVSAQTQPRTHGNNNPPKLRPLDEDRDDPKLATKGNRVQGGFNNLTLLILNFVIHQFKNFYMDMI